MADPYTYIKRKAEDAFAGLIQRRAEDDLDSIQITKGQSFNTLESSRVEVVCSRAMPQVVGDDELIGGEVTGNWFCEIQVAVMTHFDGDDGDYSRSTHGKRCGYVGDVFMAEDVVDQLNAIDAVSAFEAFAWRPGMSEDDVDEMGARTIFEGNLYCAPSAVED